MHAQVSKAALELWCWPELDAALSPRCYRQFAHAQNSQSQATPGKGFQDQVSRARACTHVKHSCMYQIFMLSLIREKPDAAAAYADACARRLSMLMPMVRPTLMLSLLLMLLLVLELVLA